MSSSKASTSKSIFRSQDARHYKLIHRSQRDPLINDPGVGERVFEEVRRQNQKDKEGTVIGGDDVGEGDDWVDDELKDEKEGEGEVRVASTSSKGQHEAGQAPLYGIDFDDRFYDYTKHLKSMGKSGGIFLAAETSESASPTIKDLQRGEIKVIEDLPEEIVAPQNLGGMKEYREWLSKQAERGERKLDPDMDFDLREVLEALEDEAYVEKTEMVVLDDQTKEKKKDDGKIDNVDSVLLVEKDKEGDDDDDDDFFGELLEGGEDKDPSQRQTFGAREETAWEKEIASFKIGKKVEFGSEFDVEDYEEMDDLGSLPDLGGYGGSNKKEWMKAESVMSGMSASTKFRNQGLRDLDEHFERIQAQYESEESEEDDDLPPEGPSQEILDEFLERYELLGNHVRPMMEGKTGIDKLDTLRKELLLDHEGKKDVLERAERIMAGKHWEDKIMELSIVGMGPDEDKWDVESILTTKTNLENHPKVLRLRKKIKERNSNGKNEGQVRITIDKHGMPSVSLPLTSPTSNSSESGEDDDDQVRKTVSRPKGETCLEKKSRKQAVKEERKERRAEKKSNKEQFGKERGRIVKELQRDREIRGVDKNVKTLRL